MNGFLAFAARTGLAVPSSVTVWLVSFFAFDQTFLLSSAIATGGGAAVYTGASVYMKHQFLKKHHLTRSEYLYIQKNLREAKPKIFRLQKALFSIKDIWSLKRRIELVRIARKIHNLTKREPKRFYKAERFYFTHLDSAVELAEKYVFLSSSPKKSREMSQSLVETSRTLEELTETIEKDLYHVLSDDMSDLKFELDVAKHSIKSNKDSSIPEEGRRL
ncbi:5-bromo-4-chloroindolyl phosphate hydrolysis family protein [Fictibacillus aquaticus]|uniref:Protein xpaC n=1 Tax=Fictibacillus aquaticus TaxID=2021314 RepID=A0A235F638_9BACL|nr:5-bromo-4-chloroindolyl phosphate hydrolysis family protein [Fictibacillus aquaticus]OYD56614.1 protein xpaC [Fictibacillus aquaticus]